MRPIILVHGGAGTALRTQLTPEQAAAMRAGLRAALAAGGAVLSAGGGALDAVEAAVRVLEDDPAFNAGRGATLTRDGTVMHDAAIMDGATGAVGALAGVSHLRHPVSAARLIGERSGHVLMIGEWAEGFALSAGAEAADPSWFITDTARADLARWQADQSRIATRGTVGAVALDVSGRLAAATSTGGLTGKRSGRIGDSPLIGAGTYADDSCAVSATGDGEGFIAAVFAHTVATAVAAGAAPATAADGGLALVARRRAKATGGAIVLASDGRYAHRWTSDDLARGVWEGDGTSRVAVFGDEGWTSDG